MHSSCYFPFLHLDEEIIQGFYDHTKQLYVSQKSGHQLITNDVCIDHIIKYKRQSAVTKLIIIN